MQQVWVWFGGDTSPWDAIGSIGVVLVAIVILIAVFRKASAAIAQAKAVRDPIQRENHHTETRSAFSEKETFPNLLIGAATDRDGAIRKDTMAILNMGGGIARDLRLRYRDKSPSCEIHLEKQVLGIRDVLPVPFDAGRGAVSGFQLSYRTDFGTLYALDFEWDDHGGRAANEKLTLMSSGSLPTPGVSHS